MPANKTLLYLIVNLVLFVACQKGEIAIEPHETGDATEGQVDISSDYKYQAYFDLETNSMVSNNLKTDWDLAFSNDNDSLIRLNTSKMMTAAKANSDFATQTDTIGLIFEVDYPGGQLDSTALYDFELNQLYVIDRGYDETGATIGLAKFIVVNVNELEFEIQFGLLDETTPNTIILSRDEAYNFAFFSFDNGGAQMSIEPPKADWDLCFTQFTYVFHEPYIPYLVTGVRINSHEVQAVLTDKTTINELTYENLSEYPLTDYFDAIGYSWKEYDFATGKYTVDAEMIYLIQSTEGYYYALHFVDFYNETGEKGNPVFEFVKL